MMLIGYRPAHLAVDFLTASSCGRPEEVLVLDVACGSGLVAKLVRDKSPFQSRTFMGADTEAFMRSAELPVSAEKKISHYPAVIL